MLYKNPVFVWKKVYVQFDMDKYWSKSSNKSIKLVENFW